MTKLPLPKAEPTPIQLKAREQAIALFHRTYATSKAYQDYVDKSGVDVSRIQSAAEFERIPLMTKDGYIAQYSLEERLSNGRTLADCYMMTSTTGSTGEPILWPRDYQADRQLVGAFERVYTECFHIDRLKTLHVIQNYLSTTPAGIVMAQLSWAASDNHSMTTITPGVEMDRALTLMEAMAPAYDQIIVSTYPRYATMLLDRAESLDVDLSNVRLKFVCTGENFSEIWRNRLVSRLGAEAVRHDVISIYGCTDAGLVGAETPLTVGLTQAVSDNQAADQALFKVQHSATTGSIFAYNPLSKLVEAYPPDTTTDQELLLTVNQPVPLIRYNIQDRGSLLSAVQVNQIISDYDLPLAVSPEDAHYLCIRGRTHCAYYHHVAIHIEDIRYGLENSQFYERFTGQFQYGVQDVREKQKTLAVVVYLQSDCTLNEQEQSHFCHEFWQNLLSANPALRALDETLLIDEKLKLTVQQSGDEDPTAGKYPYFL